MVQSEVKRLVFNILFRQTGQKVEITHHYPDRKDVYGCASDA